MIVSLERTRECADSLDRSAGRLCWARLICAQLANQTEAACRLGLPSEEYDAYESGSQSMTGYMVRGYAQKLGVPERWLLFGEGEIPLAPGVSITREALKSLLASELEGDDMLSSTRQELAALRQQGRLPRIEGDQVSLPAPRTS